MTHKKQAFSLFEDIARINNVVWNNPKGSYDDATEAAYQIEEALEGFNLTELAHKDVLAKGDHLIKEVNPKLVSREILRRATRTYNSLEDVDRFDKALDAIYFAIGSLHKLGLSPSQMVDGLQVVHDANLMKGGKKDSQGKVIKPDQWEELFAPEPKLQDILDART